MTSHRAVPTLQRRTTAPPHLAADGRRSTDECPPRRAMLNTANISGTSAARASLVAAPVVFADFGWRPRAGPWWFQVGVVSTFTAENHACLPS